MAFFKDDKLLIDKFGDRCFYIKNNKLGYWDFHYFEDIQYSLKKFNKKEILNYCIKGIQDQIKNNNYKYISSLMRLVAFREDLNEKENNNK